MGRWQLSRRELPYVCRNVSAPRNAQDASSQRAAGLPQWIPVALALLQGFHPSSPSALPTNALASMGSLTFASAGSPENWQRYPSSPKGEHEPAQTTQQGTMPPVNYLHNCTANRQRTQNQKKTRSHISEDVRLYIRTDILLFFSGALRWYLQDEVKSSNNGDINRKKNLD